MVVFACLFAEMIPVIQSNALKRRCLQKSRASMLQFVQRRELSASSEPVVPSPSPPAVEVDTENAVPPCAPPPVKMKKLKTEDTGKIFEMAICLVYGIPYDGKFKYSMEEAMALKPRLMRLQEWFPQCVHTARKGSRYDFTAMDDPHKHLSAKTTKRDGKVAPQVVGQVHPSKFCALMGIDGVLTTTELKQYIQTHIAELLPVFVEHTFDCPNVYYNKEKNSIQYIELHTPIDWSQYEFRWTQQWERWNNSSSLKIRQAYITADNVEGDVDETTLLEIQFHSKSRQNMAVRWFYENFLKLFSDNLHIRVL